MSTPARMTSWVMLSRASPRNPLRSPLRIQRGGGRIAVPAGIRSRSARARAHACAQPSIGPTPGCRGCRQLLCNRTRSASRSCRRIEGEPRRTSLPARHPTPVRPRSVDFRAWRERGGSCATTARPRRNYRPTPCAEFSTGCGGAWRFKSRPMIMNNGGMRHSPRWPPWFALCVYTAVRIAASALVEATAQALLAAFLVHERRLAALLAQIADGLLAVGRCRRRGLRHLYLTDVLGQRPGDGIGQRENLRRPEARRLGAADARELADDLLEPALSRKGRREPQRERNQPAEGFGNGHRFRAALADLGEDLEGLAFLGLVDRDVRRPDRCLHPVRRALEAVRAGLDHHGRHRRRGGSRLVLLGADADVQHLLALAAVTEHGDAETAELPRQPIGAGDIGFAGAVGQVDRLGHAIVGGTLERGLVPAVPLEADLVRGLED